MAPATALVSEPVPMDVDHDAESATAAAQAAARLADATRFFSEIRYYTSLLEKSVNLKESRYITRVLRTTSPLRKLLPRTALLHAAISTFLPASSTIRTALLSYLPEPTAEELPAQLGLADAKPAPAHNEAYPEFEAYLGFLLLLHLHDSKQYEAGRAAARTLVDFLRSANRRSLDQLAAKIFFYHARFHELDRRHAALRPELHALLRTAVLRQDTESSAVLINALLRSNLADNLVGPAEKLASRCEYPDPAAAAAAAGINVSTALSSAENDAALAAAGAATNTVSQDQSETAADNSTTVKTTTSTTATMNKPPSSVSNNQAARYLYYMARIKAIHLDYTASYRCLQLAIRKAPQQQQAAAGFLLAATKLSIIVQLLMGEIPDRATFRTQQRGTRPELENYKRIVNAVRAGDLNLFTSTLAAATTAFTADGTLTLIQRLRHNVIKTGIRLISLSYSCVSLRDICLMLSLDSEEDAEYMVAKAVHDGAIDAVVYHTEGLVRSKEVSDVYATREPLAQLNQRIAFCLDLHNSSVKAMRYPHNTHKKEFSDNEAMREIEKEIQQQLEDDDEDF